MARPFRPIRGVLLVRGALSKNAVACLIAMASSAALPVHAREAADGATLGWDLSYRSVLRANGVGRGDWLVKWLKSHESAPIERLVAKWPHEPITSSILLDAPAFHAGERMVYWLVRTNAGAYLWHYVDGAAQEAAGEPIEPHLYDRLLSGIWEWEQGPPLSMERAGREAAPGYFGFLSLHRAGSARQMLLTVEDFHVPGPAGWKDATDGRVTVAFGPLLEPHE
jgi:hypothetical protein